MVTVVGPASLLLRYTKAEKASEESECVVPAC